MIQEINYKPRNGFAFLGLFILVLASCIAVYANNFRIPDPIVGITVFINILAVIMLVGLFIIEPNGSKVMVFFGDYRGTVKENGFWWANPFYVKRKISLKARNLDGDKIKVNDAIGNPIEVAVVVVWKVNETFKAAFEVDDYINYVSLQADAAVRDMAGKYPYDTFSDEQAEVTLRNGTEFVNKALMEELAERLQLAGVEVLEARITHLAYSPEIAGAMLQRQQATAVVAARHKIVEGAVSMVDMALAHLEKDNVITLDEDRKAAMVSNLMVVLCSDKNATPVVNTGTLYQ